MHRMREYKIICVSAACCWVLVHKKIGLTCDYYAPYVGLPDVSIPLYCCLLPHTGSLLLSTFYAELARISSDFHTSLTDTSSEILTKESTWTNGLESTATVAVWTCIDVKLRHCQAFLFHDFSQVVYWVEKHIVERAVRRFGVVITFWYTAKHNGCFARKISLEKHFRIDNERHNIA